MWKTNFALGEVRTHDTIVFVKKYNIIKINKKYGI